MRAGGAGKVAWDATRWRRSTTTSDAVNAASDDLCRPLLKWQARALDQTFLNLHVPCIDPPRAGLVMRGKRPFRKLQVRTYPSRTIVLRVVRASAPAVGSPRFVAVRAFTRPC